MPWSVENARDYLRLVARLLWRPDVQRPDTSVAAGPNEAMDPPRRTESPLAIEDYALIGDCRTAALAY